jgi:hypothetical protein
MLHRLAGRVLTGESDRGTLLRSKFAVKRAQNWQPNHPHDNGTKYPSEIEDKNKW